MAAIESGSNDRLALEIDPTFLAGRMSLRPLDYKQYNGHLGGHYRVTKRTNLVTGVAAAGALLSFRWTNPDRVAVLLRAQVAATLTTVFAAAQESSVDLVRVPTMPANDTGGLAVEVANDGRMQLAMAKSLIADLRVSDTAALGAGAGNVAEGNPIGASLLALGNTAGVSATSCLFDALAGQEHPLVLPGGTGFRIRNQVAQGAGGVVQFTFTLVWAEVPSAY